jgi:hypothetical protein
VIAFYNNHPKVMKVLLEFPSIDIHQSSTVSVCHPQQPPESYEDALGFSSIDVH